jgi:hypothetical protein
MGNSSPTEAAPAYDDLFHERPGSGRTGVSGVHTLFFVTYPSHVVCY